MNRYSNTLRVGVRLLPPFINHCVVNTTNLLDTGACHRPGINADLFEAAAASAGYDKVEYVPYQNKGMLSLDCNDTGSLMQAVKCGVVDATASLAYIEETNFVEDYDYSFVTGQRGFLVVPRIPMQPLNNLTDFVQLFDVISWLCLSGFIFLGYLRRLKWVRSIAFFLAFALSKLFLLKLVRSNLVAIVIHKHASKPLFTSVEDLVRNLESDQPKHFFVAHNLILRPNDQLFDFIPRKYVNDSSRVKILSFGSPTNRVSKVIESAKIDKYPKATTLVAEYVVNKLTSEEQALIHTIQMDYKHLAYTFPRRSRFARHFNAAMHRLFWRTGTKDALTVRQSFHYRIQQKSGRYKHQESATWSSLNLKHFELIFTWLILGLLVSLVSVAVEFATRTIAQKEITAQVIAEIGRVVQFPVLLTRKEGQTVKMSSHNV